jgi:anti-sigma factor (TIGR02949 family)
MKTTITSLKQVAAGETSSPDCEKVVSLLDMIVDGEATDEDKNYFFTHVEMCKPCFEAHQKQQQLKEVLKASIKRKAFPNDLLSSIKSVIRATA